MTRTAPMPRQRKPMKRSPMRRFSAKQRKRLATWTKVVSARIARLGEQCERCQWHTAELHGHHKLPRSQGGKDTDANCALLCGLCHAWAHAFPCHAYAAGWLLKRENEGKESP